MSILNTIGLKCDTDKADHRHGYLSFYEMIFRYYLHKYDRIRLLEIGIQFGNSLRMWQSYFGDKAQIFGIDSVDNKTVFNPPDNITVKYGDAYSIEMIGYIQDHWGIGFDIIIDDASHTPQDQEWFVLRYPFMLRPSGIAIVEDVPGMDTIPLLVQAVPEGFNHAVVDLRSSEKNTKDSILFLIWRK
jgi:hypothetical protein